MNAVFFLRLKMGRGVQVARVWCLGGRRPKAGSLPEVMIPSPGVCKKEILLREPWPYNPTAETAFQPLMWHL